MFRQPAERTRIENRVLDGVGSPHLKFAVMIHAALRGYEHPENYPLGKAVIDNVFHSDVVETRGLLAVPQNFGAAIRAARGSELLQEALGERAYNRFMALREKEWGEYREEVGKLKGPKGEQARLDWECKRYWSR